MNPVALDAAQAIQAGVYQLLTGDTTLMALIEGVFDEVPEGTAYPYVTIRDTLATPDDTHDSYGEQVTLTIHTWTQALGNTEGNAIAGRVYSLMHQQHTTLDPLVGGFQVYIVRREFRHSLVDPQPGIRHRVDRYRIYVSQQEEE